MKAQKAVKIVAAIESLIREILRDPTGHKPINGPDFRKKVFDALMDADGLDDAGIFADRLMCVHCMTLAEAAWSKEESGELRPLRDTRCKCGKTSAMPGGNKGSTLGKVENIRAQKRQTNRRSPSDSGRGSERN